MDPRVCLLGGLDWEVDFDEHLGEVGYLLVENLVFSPVDDEFPVDGEIFDDLELILVVEVVVDPLPVQHHVVLFMVDQEEYGRFALVGHADGDVELAGVLFAVDVEFHVNPRRLRGLRIHEVVRLQEVLLYFLKVYLLELGQYFESFGVVEVEP